MALEKIAEQIASFTGLLAVWLNVKEKIWSWPLGLFSVCCAAYVYYYSNLYAEFYLHLFYGATNIYGWYSWYMMAGKSMVKKAPVRQLGMAEGVAVVASGILLSYFIAQLMLFFHNPDYVWIDSGVTGFSIVGQLLLSRKYVENWICWMVVDAVCVYLYLAKQLYFFTLLYIAFLALSAMGWITWKKSLPQSN